jgi:glyoxylate reductase
MMMSWNIYITRRIPESAIQLLRDVGLNINMFNEGRMIPHDILKSKIEYCEALLCLLTDQITEEVIMAGKNLNIVANFAVGFNNIDIEAATRRRIAVTNTPGVLTDSTADLAFAMILTISRRIAEAERFLRLGRFYGWDPMLMLGSELNGKTLGIIGAGRIGSSVARRASGFNLKLVYTDTKQNLQIEKNFKAVQMDLDELIKTSDFITIHVPLNNTTHHLINHDRLEMMKKSAYLINTSRGPVVDEEALLTVLKAGRIAGAALDVFEFEPEVTPGLLEMENVLLLPHIASATIETRTKMALIAAKNIIAAFQGQKPPNLVNPQIFNQ